MKGSLTPAPSPKERGVVTLALWNEGLYQLVGLRLSGVLHFMRKPLSIIHCPLSIENIHPTSKGFQVEVKRLLLAIEQEGECAFMGMRVLFRPNEEIACSVRMTAHGEFDEAIGALVRHRFNTAAGDACTMLVDELCQRLKAVVTLVQRAVLTDGSGKVVGGGLVTGCPVLEVRTAYEHIEV